MEDLACPACGENIKEEDLQKALVCPKCKTKLKNPKYIDFLELLVYYDIVDDIDFFDMNVYGDEIMSFDREEYDELDLSPDDFEATKEVWNEFEDDAELNDTHSSDTIIQSSWNIFEDEVDTIDDNADKLNDSQGKKNKKTPIKKNTKQKKTKK